VAREPIPNPVTRVQNAKTPGSAVTAKEGEAVTAAEADRNRISLTLCNLGSKNVFAYKGANAEANKGIRLAPEDPPFTITDYTGAVTLRAAEGEQLVGVCEV
jgi:hypothetical protein